ncbi:MAG: alpha-N-acetylglucosaminidase [Candidatus Pristimantibacillus sp.]
MNTESVHLLIERVVGTPKASLFELQLVTGDGSEYFELEQKGSLILITGTSNSALTSGFHWYLKHVCHMHISWCGDQLEWPNPLPVLEAPIRQTTPHEYRYYLNYCTFSYSMPFWDWDRWEKEIDWMALNGVNLALHIVGLEEVWRKLLLRLGYDEKEVSDFICGPAYFAWQWMQNMTGWGGPLPVWWYEDRAQLAARITERMKSLGIEPIVPGYSGMVPRDFGEKFAGSSPVDQGLWCHFPRPSLLLPSSSYYEEVSLQYYEELQLVYGSDIRFFSMDPFHEGGSTEGVDLTDYTVKVQQSMLRQNRDAVWVLQAWEGNPKMEILQAIDPKHALVLDLWCESKPMWTTTDAFEGVPWLWCMVQNYGGKNGLFGNLETVSKDPIGVRSDASSGRPSGLGMTMEGIGTNPVMYDLLTDMVWREESPNLDEWLASYALRRYGSAPKGIQEAWRLLRNSVYHVQSVQQGTVESILCARPGLQITRVSTWGPTEVVYEPKDVSDACKLMYEAYSECHSSDGYLYDLVDVTRQAVDDLARGYYNDLIRAYHENNAILFDKMAGLFLQLIQAQERLLRTRKEFLLGPWIADARKLGRTAEEKDLFEFNARTLVTLWGPEASAQVLRDYSHRVWSGLMEDFYLPRWRLFIESLSNAIRSGKDPETIDWYAWEYQWTIDKKAYPTEPSGSIFEIVGEIMDAHYTSSLQP